MEWERDEIITVNSKGDQNAGMYGRRAVKHTLDKQGLRV